MVSKVIISLLLVVHLKQAWTVPLEDAVFFGSSVSTVAQIDVFVSRLISGSLCILVIFF